MDIKNTKSRLKEIFLTIRKFLVYFGWIYIIVVIVCGILLCLGLLKELPIIFLVMVLFLLIFFPLKLIYSLVGIKNNLTFFFILFIITQLLFSALYSSYLDGEKVLIESTVIKDNLPDNILETCTCRTKPLYHKIDHWDIVLSTFHSSFIQQSSPLFTKIISDESHPNYRSIYIIMNIQLLISWIFLGVLITCLYQKMRNE